MAKVEINNTKYVIKPWTFQAQRTALYNKGSLRDISKGCKKLGSNVYVFPSFQQESWPAVAMVQMKVGKCPSDALSLKNRVIINPGDQANLLHGAKHVSITTGPGTNAQSLLAMQAFCCLVKSRMGWCVAPYLRLSYSRNHKPKVINQFFRPEVRFLPGGIAGGEPGGLGLLHPTTQVGRAFAQPGMYYNRIST